MAWTGALARALLPSSKRRWVDVGRVVDYPVESVRCVQARGTTVAVFHTAEGFAAIADVCPHMGAPLSDGVLHDDGYVQCPEHAMRFSLIDGGCPESPMYTGRVYPTRVRRGRVYVQA